MNKIRVLKKTNPLIKSVEQHSRQIISNIYTQHEDQGAKLEFRTLLSRDPVPQPLNNQVHSQPNHIINSHIILFFQHLAKTSLYIQICPFILLHTPYLYMIYGQKTIIIKKKSFQLKTLKYWHNHFYFSRIKDILIEQMFEYQHISKKQEKVMKKTIHNSEEHFSMPSCLVMVKNDKPLIKNMKLSNSQEYIKKGELEQQAYCVGYFVSGTQQLFSFSQTLQFMNYSLNLKEIKYFKILPRDSECMKIFLYEYSSQHLSQESIKIKSKFRKIYKKTSRQAELKYEIEEKKIKLAIKKQYQSYAELLTLQMVVCLEIQEDIIIQQLKLQWILNNENVLLLSNVLSYRQKQAISNETQEGLDTLYQRIHPFHLKIRNNPQNVRKVSKKLKSEEKYNSYQYRESRKLPNIDKVRSKTNDKYQFSRKVLGTKAKSCFLKNLTGRSYVLL